MLRDILDELRRPMADAGQRLDRLPAQAIDWLLLLALGVALAGILLGLQGGYHAGFGPLHRLLGTLLPDFLWAFITRFGDERVLLVLSVLLARRRPEIFWSLLVSALLASLYAQGLKHLVDALRPPAVLPMGQLHVIGPVLYSHSFPSGHSTSAFVFAGVLGLFARSSAERLTLLGMALLVACSRIALGVHWPQDVLAGAFGGLLAAALGTWLANRWRAGLHPGVHLALLLLPLFGMFSLLMSNNGNPAMPWLTWPLVFAMLAQLILDYRVYRP